MLAHLRAVKKRLEDYISLSCDHKLGRCYHETGGATENGMSYFS